MSIFQKLVRKADELYIKATSKDSTPEEIERKIHEKANQRQQDVTRRQEEAEIRRREQECLKQERLEKEKHETLAVLSHVVDIEQLDYTAYEYNEVKRNRSFFSDVEQRVFENGEVGLSFLGCEFDKSSKKEFKGYLFVTNKRVIFIDRRLQNFHKFRYQTIINVNWFHDGILEKGLYIQYGQKRLEFDEIYDTEQMKRVGDLILRMSRR